jgi:glycerophosphoryl diester phosphodiesterase
MLTIFFSFLLIDSAFSMVPFTVMSHRGVYQNYSREGLTPETCTAERIYTPTHSFLENTLPSMRRAFELGADSVELDIHSTADGRIVVFHDWTLDCRTNGEGDTQNHKFEDLRKLDIGFRYTADNHRSYPFRCNSEDKACLLRNRMPSLEEVLSEFPSKRFVINMKSRNPKTLEILVEALRAMEKKEGYSLGKLSFFCDDQSINDRMRVLIPEIDTPKLAWSGVKDCWRNYDFKSGSFPQRCYGAYLALPVEELVRLGPDASRKMIRDVQNIGSKFWVVRVDNAETFKFVRELPVNGIWTDAIDIIGPLL